MDDDGLQSGLRFGLPALVPGIHGQVDLSPVAQVAHGGGPVAQLLGHLLHGLSKGLIVKQNPGAVGVHGLGGDDPVQPVHMEPHLGIDLNEDRTHAQQHQLPEAGEEDAKTCHGGQHGRDAEPARRLRLPKLQNGVKLLAHLIAQVGRLEKTALPVHDHGVAGVALHDQIFHYRSPPFTMAICPRWSRMISKPLV